MSTVAVLWFRFDVVRAGQQDQENPHVAVADLRGEERSATGVLTYMKVS